MKLKTLFASAVLPLIGFSLTGCGHHLPSFTSCVIISSKNELFCDNEKTLLYPPNPFMLCVSPRDSERVDRFFVSLIKAKESKACAPKYPLVRVCATQSGGLLCEDVFITFDRANKFICVSQRDDEVITNWIIETKKDLVDC